VSATARGRRLNTKEKVGEGEQGEEFHNFLHEKIKEGESSSQSEMTGRPL